jgi:hypothetical protein
MLGVFASAFTLEDAAEVLKAFCSKAELTRALQTLLDRHLIARSEHSTQNSESQNTSLTLRFAFLDTVKEFAHEQLTTSTHKDDVEKAHALHFAERYSDLIVQMRAGEIGSAVSGFLLVHHEIDVVLQVLLNKHMHDIYLRASYQVSILFFLRGLIKLAHSYVDTAISAIPIKTPSEAREVGWCHYVEARCFSFAGNHLAAIQSATAAKRASDQCGDDYLSEKVDMQLAAEHIQQLNFSAARIHCTKLLHRGIPTEVYEANWYVQASFLAATVEVVDGHASAALAIATEGFEIAIKSANAQMAVLLLIVQAEALISIGGLVSASTILAELSARFSMHTAPTSALSNKYLEVLIALESLDFEAAETTLASADVDQVQHASDYFRVPALILRDVIAYERNDCVSSLGGTRIHAKVLCDAEWAHIWVRRWVYYVKRASRRDDWNAVCKGMNELIPILRKTKNGLWYSWLFDACAFVLLAKGEWDAAESLLDYSKQLIETAGIKATPRQQRDWSRIAAAIAAQRESATDASKNPAPNEWFGARGETLRLLQDYMHKALGL